MGKAEECREPDLSKPVKPWEASVVCLCVCVCASTRVGVGAVWGLLVCLQWVQGEKCLSHLGPWVGTTEAHASHLSH